MADPDTESDLRERVAELEATVEAQQETIQQLLPSRRRVLQAGGLLAGGGLLGALSADRASADVTGQVGTQQDRVDVFGGAVDANSVNTEELFTSPAGVRLQKTTTQSAADGALVDPVTWESALEYNSDAPAFGDATNNVITVPNDDYSLAKFTVSIEMSEQVEFDFLDLRRNSQAFSGQFRISNLADSTAIQATSSWIPVSSGEDYKVRLRQVSGSPVDIQDVPATWFSGVFF